MDIEYLNTLLPDVIEAAIQAICENFQNHEFKFDYDDENSGWYICGKGSVEAFFEETGDGYYEPYLLELVKHHEHLTELEITYYDEDKDKVLYPDMDVIRIWENEIEYNIADWAWRF